MAAAETVIVGRPRPRLLRGLRELTRYRSMILAFAERDLRVKYKQTFFGIAWSLIQPLAMMAIFTVAFGRFLGVATGGVPYAVFALAALVPWMFLFTSLSLGSEAVLNNAPLIRKAYFPREAPVIGTILAATVDFAVGLALFYVASPVLGGDVFATWLLAPLLAVPLALLAAGAACGLGAMMAYYRDVRYALPFVLQLWVFASPVAYPLSAVPERWRDLYALVNPAAGILEAFRQVLAMGQLPAARPLALSSLTTVVIAWLGYRVFKMIEPRLADVL